MVTFVPKASRKKEEKTFSLLGTVMPFMQIGFSVAICAVIFIGSGQWFDKKFDAKPIFTISGIVIGLVTSFYMVWKIVAEMRRLAERDLSKKS